MKVGGLYKKRSFLSFKKQKSFVEAFEVQPKIGAVILRENLPSVEPSPLLRHSLARAMEMPLLTEKIVSEALIFPVLVEAFTNFRDKITLFSGVQLKVPFKNEFVLNGVCDFLFDGKPRRYSPESPIICVAVAEKQDFDSGTWQCAAELVACKIQNEAAGRLYPFYYGCITSGPSWIFIQLDCKANMLLLDTYFYGLNDLNQLLGAWKWVLDAQLSVAPA